MSGRSREGHRPGPLKQQNKAHKHGRHKSKGHQSDSTKGRVGLKATSRQVRHQQRRADKRNRLKQLRKNKRDEVLQAKRERGGEGVPPHLLVIIPLDPSIELVSLFKLLTSACGGDESLPFSHTSTHLFPLTKQRFTLAFPSPNDLYSILDVAKLADCLLFVYPASMADLPPSSHLLLDCCSSQGLPATAHAVMGFKHHSGKVSSKARKTLQSTINKRFPMELAALHILDSTQAAVNLLRYIGNLKRRPVHTSVSHSHLVTQEVSYVKEEEKLKITGYVRSRPLSVNGLLHIPGVGDFQMSQIDAAIDLCPLKPSHSRAQSGSMEAESCVPDEGMEEEVKVLEVADPAKQVSLESEVVPDPMEGEQTWPTEEELREAEEEFKAKQVVRRERRRVPPGTSDYQAAWIVEESGESEDEEGVVSGEEDDMAPPPALEESSEEEEGEEYSSVHGSEMDTDTMTLPDTDKYDANIDLESEEHQLELLRAERENKMFPDEVDTPRDTLAKIRFQKYRGLKSFRHSLWDPKENLPSDYARIYQFDNFNRTRRRVLAAGSGRGSEEAEFDQGALPGWYVTVHVSGVPPPVAEMCTARSSPLVVYGLLPHENKMTVVHFALRRVGDYVGPIKSKDQLIFHCGVRRFVAGPIYSQHTAANKHKFEKFFHMDCTIIASVYAPVSYPPQPVLVFKQLTDGSQVLVACGSLLSVNPDRVVCKRIVLSGHPFKINKRSAVIRYMFFNREDIVWFKPVELRTKYGRRGHIKEPLGTHGHMKCVFDGQLKAQDTVLMNLYKRVYPKWTYSTSVPRPLTWSGPLTASNSELMQQ